MVSHSTPQSREAKEVSKLAIFETIFFTLLVLAVTIYIDTTIYLLSSILIAPFLLLKTPRSIALSHKMFLYKPKIDKKLIWMSWKIWIIFVLITFIISIILLTEISPVSSSRDKENIIIPLFMSISALFTYIFMNIVISAIYNNVHDNIKNSTFVSDSFSVSFVFIVVIIPILIFFVVILLYMNNKLTSDLYFFIRIIIMFGFILSSFIGSSVFIGLFVRSLIVKFIATIYDFILELFTNPIKLLENIAQNYREQLWVNDVWYPAELLPNISKVDAEFSLTPYLTWKGDTSDRIIRIFIVPIWSLAYLYRWSIKSTAWFYFPLAFLANTTQKCNDEKIVKKDIDIQTNSIKLKFNIGVALMLFISLFGMVFKDKIVDLLELSKSIYALFDILKGFKLPIVVDSWSVYLVTVSTFIYFVVYYFVDRQQSYIEKGNEGYSQTVNKILFWTIRVHLVLWMVAFGLTLYSSYMLHHEMLRENILALFNL